MAKGDWLYKSMKLIGPPMVATRQLTRSMRRQNAKKRRAVEKEEAREASYEAMMSRVQARRDAGKRPVQWPSWWRGRPTGVL